MRSLKSGAVWPARIPRRLHPLLQRVWPGTIWSTEASEAIHLTFDDGPTPGITPWVLECLQEHNMTATFFVIGRNAGNHPELLQSIVNQGHALGAHTMEHEHGWRTSTLDYVQSAKNSLLTVGPNHGLFRPPFGKLTRAQAKSLARFARIVMWDVLSGDYAATGEDGANRVLARLKSNTRPGSIVVFHDSLKCQEVLMQVLPAYLAWLHSQGWTSVRLEGNVPAEN